MTDEKVKSLEDIASNLLKIEGEQRLKIQSLEDNISFLHFIINKQFELLCSYAMTHQADKANYPPDPDYKELYKLLNDFGYENMSEELRFAFNRLQTVKATEVKINDR